MFDFCGICCYSIISITDGCIWQEHFIVWIRALHPAVILLGITVVLIMLHHFWHMRLNIHSQKKDKDITCKWGRIFASTPLLVHSLHNYVTRFLLTLTENYNNWCCDDMLSPLSDRKLHFKLLINAAMCTQSGLHCCVNQTLYNLYRVFLVHYTLHWWSCTGYFINIRKSASVNVIGANENETLRWAVL